MIHLDANILIALPNLIQQQHPLIERVVSGEEVGVCSAVWYEFLIGPLDETERGLALHFIRDSVLPVTADDASLAAALFNRSGRRRGLKTDALIAAAAIRAGADFLTFNQADFKLFVPDGLRLFEAL